ncbi:hypothetical protein COCC4DRAFT_27997 [Bipolaris maydis ATCC 48331]|uniref:Uncharacterized protein n=2 Tax=Cochliobolus heterostrophus TaxID=5016 RepID=M2T8B2_COCH5|nr:uncharacterized protein COCC4DRAFT_27997 [Bipolaris maydis ATCC 48331]EMD93820.1 hypothetical protein COCHEDRAFT_1028947 [Bipolaris maydis C5]ENH99884.1 hypothetical protein COCC4DRAFT_27997 [Bipolaris maydis ATCC 48331]
MARLGKKSLPAPYPLTWGRKRHSVARRHVALRGMTGSGRLPVNLGRSAANRQLPPEPVLSHESHSLYGNHNQLGSFESMPQALVPSMERIASTCQTVSYRPPHVEALAIQLK